MRRQNIKIKKRYGTVTVSGQILPTFNFNKLGCSRFLDYFIISLFQGNFLREP